MNGQSGVLGSRRVNGVSVLGVKRESEEFTLNAFARDWGIGEGAWKVGLAL